MTAASCESPSASALKKHGWWRNAHVVWAAGTLVLALGAAILQGTLGSTTSPLTQKDIDVAVRRSLEASALPSAYARAFTAIQPSVVRVEGLSERPPNERRQAAGRKARAPAHDPAPGAEESSPEDGLRTVGTGTGVVIVDNGTILTNLHVVSGAERLRVTFADGSESDAMLVGMQSEHDLAVLRAHKVPDDLQAATIRSTTDLVPGDQVVAVGYPFGIGPSTSGGVISGLKREFRSPSGQRTLTNLIQFDAAANPGNSGGPLVDMDGAVIGIVTAILNPSDQRTFIGIGFAVPIENAATAAGMPPF